MPAPDLDTLLDFETNIENAAVSFLNAATGVDVYQSLGQGKFVTPRIEVHMSIGEADDPPDPKWIDSSRFTPTSPECEYRKYNGSFVVRIITDASVDGNTDTPAIHRQIRSQVRAALLLNATSWDSLQYYAIKYLRPVSASYSIDDDLAVSELEYQMRFVIKDDAWPE